MEAPNFKVECRFHDFIALQSAGSSPPGRPLLLATATGPAYNAPNIAEQPQGLAKRNAIKITDFGIGGASAVNSMKQMGLSGNLGDGQLSTTDQLSMLRGSGNPLYMSPE